MYATCLHVWRGAFPDPVRTTLFSSFLSDRSLGRLKISTVSTRRGAYVRPTEPKRTDVPSRNRPVSKRCGPADHVGAHCREKSYFFFRCCFFTSDAASMTVWRVRAFVRAYVRRVYVRQTHRERVEKRATRPTQV